MPRASLRRALAFLIVLALALTSACSDNTNGSGDAGPSRDASADSAMPDATTADLDAGPTLDAADATGDARQPHDTNNDWNWDIGGDGGEQAFALEKVVPPSGPVEGGNRVRIVGTGFAPGVKVFFGSHEMHVDVTAEQMLGQVPPASGPGPVTVKAIAPDGQVRTLVDAYEYVAGLHIDSVTPSRVPTDGGVEVEVRGSGFSPQSAVSFSGDPALRVTYVDDSLLRVVVPPRHRGYADVRVTTQSASTVAERAVAYFAPLEIDAVRPAGGPLAGGNNVTIEGSGFTSATTFVFGGQAAQVVSVDPQASTATVTVPAHAAGLVDVRAHNANDDAILPNAYLYRADTTPALAALSPAFGPASGGTEVTLVGEGLDAPGAEFDFGGNAATVVDRAETYAVVKTPPGATGSVDVVMRDASGELGRLDRRLRVPRRRVDRLGHPRPGADRRGHPGHHRGKRLYRRRPRRIWRHRRGVSGGLRHPDQGHDAGSRGRQGRRGGPARRSEGHPEGRLRVHRAAGGVGL